MTEPRRDKGPLLRLRAPLRALRRMGPSLKLALAYVVFGFVWIATSDAFIEGLVTDPGALTRWQTYKGWAFVLASGALIYTLSARAFRRRRELTRARERDAAQYQALVENGRDMIVVIDTEGTVLYASPAHKRVLGFEPAERIGAKVVDLVHPEDVPQLKGAIHHLVEDGQRSADLELRARGKDGAWRSLDLTLRNLLDSPAVSGIVINAQDVTEAKRLRDEVAQRGRMEAVGALAGGIAHDFNNALTVILSSTNLAIDETPTSDPLRETLEDIRDAAEHAASLTHQILTFSNHRPLRTRTCDLNGVVHQIERLLARTVGENIELVVDTAPDPLPVDIEPSKVEQVVMNLAVNAKQAMGERGRLTITTAQVELDPEDTGRHASIEPGRYARLVVEDDGPGIPPDVRRRIFEPFFSTKKDGGGTGLGLSMSYGTVRQHGGHIWVYSEPGEGASFRIYLPLSSGAPSEQPAADGPEGDVRGTEHVLLVEDEEAVRRLVVKILERQGYRVTAASGSEAARDALANADRRFDAVVTDLVLRDGSGVDVANDILAREPDARILLMSGYAEPTNKIATIRSAAVRFIEKPFAPRQLGRKLRELLDG